jgi:hypothetical protein
MTDITAEMVRAFASDSANWPQFAEILGEVLPKYVAFRWGDALPYKPFFKAWQAAGVTIMPNHFYSPVPELNRLTAEDLARPLPLDGIEMRDDHQLAFLAQLTAFKSEYAQFLGRPPSPDGLFHFGGAFSRIDAELLYATVRHLKPARFVEVGTGFSTLAISEACLKNRDEGHECEFISIDPFPNDILSYDPKGLTRHFAARIEEVSPSIVGALQDGDILFIDSTHILKVASDVEYEFFRIIPRIARGVHVHLHDIFLPYAYPPRWLEDEHVFWNEQYLLAAFLAFNDAFEVTLAASYLASRYPEALRAAVPGLPDGRLYPGSFWMRRNK